MIDYINILKEKKTFCRSFKFRPSLYFLFLKLCKNEGIKVNQKIEDFMISELEKQREDV